MIQGSVLFEERQQFRQWWVWIILLGTDGIFLVGVFKQVIGGEQFGNKPASNTELLIMTGLFVLFTLLFFSTRLDTLIKNDGIYVRFFPFQLKFKHYRWDQLIKSFVRQYSPIAEYGGWGLRFGLFGRGKAFNVSGNQGLQLEFTDGKKLLIGTQKPEELTEVLDKIGRLNP